VTVIGLIAGFGMLRLGIVPHGPEIMRLVAWVVVTIAFAVVLGGWLF